ncbi:MAG: glycosyltransferase [Candidatus Taylorbacteria bacterium]|nr:glycosyltransferase [Candidatus Taylorbacteria bacterium]
MGKHLIIASYDGISTYYCGIGTTMQDTISSLNKLADSEKIKISLAYISADPDGKAFNHERLNNSIALVKKTGGHLIPLCNGSAGFSEFDMWQSFPQWEYACASLATALNVILKDEDDNILMLHDTPFLLFHKFKQQIFGKKLRCFYMPRSAGLNHKFGDEEWRQKRVKLEKEAFLAIQKDPNASVLAIGRNFSEHLIKDYGLSFTENDYLINGLYFGRYKKVLDKKFDISDLEKFGINLDQKSKIIFCWGRASIAKGLKELLEAWKEIASLLPDHYMIIQAPNNSGEDDYFQSLKKYEKEIPRTIVIDDFNPEIWQTILRTKNTDIVCVPSTMDPIPHTAIEAKLFSAGMEYVIIGSNIDGVKDIFTKDECIWVNPYNQKDFSDGILKAARLGNEERNSMYESNSRSLFMFNYLETIRNFLKKINLI